MKVLQDSDNGNDSPTYQDDIKSNLSVPLDQDICAALLYILGRAEYGSEAQS